MTMTPTDRVPKHRECRFLNKDFCPIKARGFLMAACYSYDCPNFIPKTKEKDDNMDMDRE